MLLRRCKNILLPPCVFCGSRCTPDEDYICVDCFDDLPWQEQLATKSDSSIASVIAPLAYDFPVDAALKAIKFQRRLDYVPAFAGLLANLGYAIPQDIDALLPVPLHWRCHAMRGFNQATELACRLRDTTGLPMLRNFIRRKATTYQTGLEAQARQRNLNDAFAVRGRCSARHVLIVDDVITTGATTRALARVVLQAGAGKVSVLAVASTR